MNDSSNNSTNRDDNDANLNKQDNDSNKNDDDYNNFNYNNIPTIRFQFCSKHFKTLSVNKNVLKNNILHKLAHELNKYRKEKILCDFRINTINNVYYVHKLILSASSTYFKILFDSSYFIENSNNYVDIKDIENDEVMETVLNYIYTGEIDINFDTIQDIVEIAQRFQLNELIESCSLYLEQNLHTQNCISILCFTDFFGLTKLCFDTKRFIENNFAEIIKEDEFLNLPSNLLRSFLKSENLSIISEYQLLFHTIRWIHWCPPERLKYLDEFLKIIRLPVISKESINNLLKMPNDPIVSQALQNYLEKNSNDFSSNTNICGYDTIRLKPRLGCRRAIYLFGGRSTIHNRPVHIHDNNDGTLSGVVKYNIHNSSWMVTKPLRYPRSSHSVVQLNNKLYVIGGICDTLILETMEIYDPFNNISTMGPHLNIPRWAFGACSFANSFIFVFGGLGGGGQFIEKFDVKANNWEIYDQLLECRHGMQVIENDGLIYLIGGADSNGIVTNKVICYEPMKKKFRTLAPLNQARESFGACVYNENYIYVFGGRGSQGDCLSSVEHYNIIENKWSLISEMPVAKSNFCTVSINNLMYMFGGRGSSTNHPGKNQQIGKKVFVYDPELNEWMTSKPLLYGRCDAAAVIVGCST